MDHFLLHSQLYDSQIKTICETTTELTITRKRDGDGGLEAVLIPKIINDYNSFMGGVDAVDQHFVYYAIGRRDVKWWRRVFYRLLEMLIVNAYAIHKINNTGTQKKLYHIKLFVYSWHNRCVMTFFQVEVILRIPVI